VIAVVAKLIDDLVVRVEPITGDEIALRVDGEDTGQRGIIGLQAVVGEDIDVCVRGEVRQQFLAVIHYAAAHGRERRKKSHPGLAARR